MYVFRTCMYLCSEYLLASHLPVTSKASGKCFRIIFRPANRTNIIQLSSIAGLIYQIIIRFISNEEFVSRDNEILSVGRPTSNVYASVLFINILLYYRFRVWLVYSVFAQYDFSRSLDTKVTVLFNYFVGVMFPFRDVT